MPQCRSSIARTRKSSSIRIRMGTSTSQVFLTSIPNGTSHSNEYVPVVVNLHTNTATQVPFPYETNLLDPAIRRTGASGWKGYEPVQQQRCPCSSAGEYVDGASKQGDPVHRLSSITSWSRSIVTRTKWMKRRFSLTTPAIPALSSRAADRAVLLQRSARR